MSTPFSARVIVPDDVLVSELDGESVLLHLGTESYFGLRSVSSRAWELLVTSDSIQRAFEVLATEYDVDSETLRRDLTELVEELVQRGLVTIADA